MESDSFGSNQDFQLIKCSELCQAGTLDPKKVKGKILVCLRGVNSRVDKGLKAAQAGAVGMVLANDAVTQNEILADAHVLPAAHISYSDGVSVFSYINSTKSLHNDIFVHFVLTIQLSPLFFTV